MVIRRWNIVRWVNCYGTVFAFDSLLPEISDFLKIIYDGSGFIRIDTPVLKLTRNVIQNIHSYDLNDIEINLMPYANYLTERQLFLLRIKYRDVVGKKVLLPPSGFLKEDRIAKEKNNGKQLTI